MSNREVEYLIENKIIPNDSVIIHQRHNTITKSLSEGVVCRIAAANNIDDTPQDVAYSHRIAWEANDYSNSILAPIKPSPVLFENLVVSEYPLGQDCDYRAVSISDICRLVDDFNRIDINNLSTLRKLDVYSYVQKRIENTQGNNAGNEPLKKWLQYYIDYHKDLYFSYIKNQPSQLVHGDLHSQNIISHDGRYRLIDLDSASVGPPLYDLASWHLKYHSRDDANIDVGRIIDLNRRKSEWDNKLYQAMIGWKALSSMSYLLINYERYPDYKRRLASIGETAIKLCPINPPGDYL